MKHLVMNACVALLMSGSAAYAQEWGLQESPTKNNLLDVAFWKNTIGYITGERGTILITRDGGKKWDQLKAPTDETITSVTVIDSAKVMITTAGNGGKAAVYESKDQGKTWISTLTDDRPFYAIAAPGNVLFSSSSAMYRSNNLGRKWEKGQSLTLTTNFTKLEFPDAQTGYVAGNIAGVLTYSADIIRTADGGDTWYKLDNFRYPNANAYTALSAVSADTVLMFTNFYNKWVAGDSSQLMLMTNFKLNNYLGTYLWGFDKKIIVQSFPGMVNDCRFFTSGNGFAVAENGSIFSTPDFGNTWKKEYKGSGALRALFMADEKNGYAVGDGGVILKRGARLAPETPGSTVDLKVYPNPASSIVYLEMNIPAEMHLVVQVTDNQGNVKLKKIVGTVDAGDRKIAMPVNTLPRGVYHLQLISQQTVLARKEILISK